MSLRSIGLASMAGACCIAGLTGCDWSNETGFVEINRSVSLNASDLLVLNSTELAGLAQKDHLIIQERIGAASLQLKHGENSQKLCDFEIKKNRVVTVTLTYVSSSLRCTVQT